MNVILTNNLINLINNTDDNIIHTDLIQNYIFDINEKIKDLFDLLNDINNNNIDKLKNLQKELFIEKESMKPFIKYLMLYNTFLNNTYS
jgi:hypothetical protein